MVVLITISCPPSLRGDLSKWLFQVGTGVFAGDLNARVRENLWKRVLSSISKGKAIMIYSMKCEQKFKMVATPGYGEIKDFDGLELLFHPEVTESRKKESNPSTYVVMDLETTGLDPKKDHITEIALLEVINWKPSGEFKKFIRIPCPIPKQIQKLTGITDDLLEKQGEPLKKVLSEAIHFISDRPLVCHNAQFDLDFFTNGCSETGLLFVPVDVIDTLELAYSKVKGLQSYRLKDLAIWAGIAVPKSHEALSDCYTTSKLLEKLNEISS